MQEKIVSLMEILRVYAHVFVELESQLGSAILELNKSDIWDDPPDQRKMLTILMQKFHEVCTTAELPVTGVLVSRITNGLAYGEADPETRAYCDNALLQTYLLQLKSGFVAELSTKLFLQVPANRRDYFDKPIDGWEKIVERFPDCLADVEEMRRCFSLSRYTAVLFHAMQVAEWGAIELGNHIEVTDPKHGWGPTSKKLKSWIDGGHSKLPATITVSFAFLEQMHREIESMVLAWRHKVDHAANRLAIIPNTSLSPDIAEHIMQSVKVFMARLAEGFPK